MNIPKGERYELCRSVHAEANCIISAARREMIDATLYLVGKDYAYGIPTPYVNSVGVYIDEEGNTGRCWYWLRSPGSSQSNVSKIEYDGTVNYRGTMVDYSKYGVRPAIRVSVDKIGTLID